MKLDSRIAKARASWRLLAHNYAHTTMSATLLEVYRFGGLCIAVDRRGSIAAIRAYGYVLQAQARQRGIS